MDPTNLILTVSTVGFSVIVAGFGLQTFWMAFSMNKMYKGLDKLGGEISGVRGEISGVRGELHGLRGELHTHEVACQERSNAVEIRLDRLERRETTG